MVGYGKSIVRARREGWKEAYLDYHRLKDIVLEIEELLASRNSDIYHHLQRPPSVWFINDYDRLEPGRQQSLNLKSS